MRANILLTAIVLALLVPSSGAAQPSFQGLGQIPGFNGYEALGISADGSIVVGRTTRDAPWPFSIQGFRWSAPAGITLLPSKDSIFPPSSAYAISGDGSLIVGQNSNEAYAWTGAGALKQSFGVYGTPPFPPGFSYGAVANAASADGSVIVGESSSHLGEHAFRWTAPTGMTSLGYLPGTTSAYAQDTSADGSLVVGWATASGAPNRAFRWTAPTGMLDLGLSPAQPSRATAVSADTSTIVGWAGPTDQTRAFRWTASTGPVEIGALGDWSRALDVSANGRIVVGAAENGAFIWNPDHGIRSLKSVLTNSGLDLNGWHLGAATAITADGATITGWGFNPAGQSESWIAQIEVPEPAMLPLLFSTYACTRRRRAVQNLP
jgi:probable HAF family extracellular repeat protein